MTTEGLAVGLLVTHRMWGLGKVVHLDPQNVWVYFKDINGTHLKDAVKQLNRRVAVLTIAAKQSDAALDNLPPMVRDGRVAPPHRLRITEQQAVDRFVAKFPRSRVPSMTRPIWTRSATTSGKLTKRSRQNC